MVQFMDKQLRLTERRCPDLVRNFRTTFSGRDTWRNGNLIRAHDTILTKIQNKTPVDEMPDDGVIGSGLKLPTHSFTARREKFSPHNGPSNNYCTCDSIMENPKDRLGPISTDKLNNLSSNKSLQGTGNDQPPSNLSFNSKIQSVNFPGSKIVAKRYGNLDSDLTDTNLGQKGKKLGFGPIFVKKLNGHRSFLGGKPINILGYSHVNKTLNRT